VAATSRFLYHSPDHTWPQQRSRTSPIHVSRRSAAAKSKRTGKMTANGPVSDWTAEVIGFLARNLPASRYRVGWEHNFLSAYQMGCMALAALGQAKKTVDGAVPLENPRLPQVLPRWDDVCVAVLWLADQQDMLIFLPDGDYLGDGDAPRLRMSLLENSVYDASPLPSRILALRRASARQMPNLRSCRCFGHWV
jgi:hypothetical protein